MNFPSQCLLLRLSHSNCPTVSASLSAQPRREPRPKQMPCEKYDRGSTSGARSEARRGAPHRGRHSRESGGGWGQTGASMTSSLKRRRDFERTLALREELEIKQKCNWKSFWCSAFISDCFPPSLLHSQLRPRIDSFHPAPHEKEKKHLMPDLNSKHCREKWG